jgi:cytochrome P450 family 142 subfamily A polypeptide 1
VPDHPTRDDIDLCSGAFWAGDHHEALTWMRAEAPVYFDGTVWGVTRYADVKDVSRQPEVFSNAGGIRPQQGPLPMMIDMDDPAHLQRRKLVNKGFTPRRVRDSEPQVRKACAEIVDAVIERGSCDLVNEVAAHLPMIMIGDALGVRPEDRADLLRWSDDMLKGLATEATPEQLEATGNAYGEYVAYANEVIADRRSEPRDDLMSILVHAEVDGHRLDDEEIVQESLLILIGGDETTRHVISGGMHQLLLHPEQRRALRADPSRIPRAVEEMLRWVSPIQNMMRTAFEEAEVGGHRFGPGDRLLLVYPSANRDESVFAEPFRFDVARDPNPHVAFGGRGAHFCLGSSLARLELRVMFEELLRRFPEMELASSEPPPLRPANFVVGIEHLPVRFPPARREG